MTKNISITDDIYSNLSKLKRKNENFSDVIRRLLSNSLLSDIAGTKTFSFEELEDVKSVFDKNKSLDEVRKKKLLDQIVK